MNDYQRLLTLIRARRSVRRFTPEAVSRESVRQVLEAARWAPSNHNRQPWKFLVLDDHRQILALAEKVGAELGERMKALPPLALPYTDEFVHYATCFVGAPILMVVLYKRPVRVSKLLLGHQDQRELVSGEPLSAAMAVQNLLLAAHVLGLGACVLTGPLIVSEVIRRELRLPGEFGLSCLVALGHPDESPEPPRRKRVDQISEFREDAGDVDHP